MINGYNNVGLDVDLSSGEIEEFQVEDDVITGTLGGRGMGVFYLLRDVSPNIDPFSDENMLVISSGGLGGSIAPTGGRFSVTFKSPLTGTIGSSNSGGFWGMSFVRTGYDVLLIRGRANAPVYLFISEDRRELVECPELWGMTMPSLTNELRARYSQSVKVLGIGPAGENRVRFAAMMNDYSRAVGRGGPGAVMGSKYLKAIVVEGKKKFTAVNTELYETGLYQANKLLRSMPVTSKALPELGTAGLVKLVHEHDMLPHRNFQDVHHRLEDIEMISGEYLKKKILTSQRGCFNCRIRCGRLTQVEERKGEGPEFETIALMGANLEIYDIEEVALANYVCNDMGIDTISFGNTVGLTMELYEKGIVRKATTGGADLPFGKRGVLEELARQTAYRRGFGDEIAEGALRLGRKHGVEELAMAVKGLELPGYDPRASLLQALGYATASRGGCHLKGGYAITLGFFGGSREVDRFLVDTVAGHIVNEQDSGCVADSLGICRFSFFSFGENELSRIYSGYTGLDISPDDLKKIAKKTIDMERLFNMEAGFTKEDDTLPLRFFHEKIPISGKMRAIDFDEQFSPMLRKYYEVRKWNEDGVPKEKTALIAVPSGV
ncbi:MAG: aldehyde ferredoxin oxidoreductase family protein [bacterium]